MDRQKLNTAYNTLKQAVGQNGAFVLLCVSHEGEQEERHILTSGPLTLNLGILSSMAPMAEGRLLKRLEADMKDRPRQPD